MSRSPRAVAAGLASQPKLETSRNDIQVGEGWRRCSWAQVHIRSSIKFLEKHVVFLLSLIAEGYQSYRGDRLNGVETSDVTVARDNGGPCGRRGC